MRHRVQVTGMTCTACSARIEKVLGRRSDVETVAVNYASESAFVEGSISEDGLREAIEAIGYGVVEKGQGIVEEFSTPVLVGTILASLPVFLLGMGWLDIGPSGLWVQLLLSAAVLLGAGRSFYVRAFKLARSLESNMDSLVAVGTGAAFLLSTYNMFWGNGVVYFESTVVIISFVFIGKYIEGRAKHSTLRAIEGLAKLNPKQATRFRSFESLSKVEDTELCPSEALQLKDIVLVRVGDALPCDGKIVEGKSSVDSSMMTGESDPIQVAAGDSVIGGTINISAPLAVEVSATGEASTLARIIRLVQDSQNSKPQIQNFADQLAGRFVPIVFLISILSLVYWLMDGAGYEAALMAAISVLVISCPCAMGLATPIALVAASGSAARNGILVKDLASLELLQSCQMAIFDKTGTLTLGQAQVQAIEAPAGRELLGRDLAIAKSLEKHSNHPLAKGILSYIDASGHKLHEVSLDNVQEQSGLGLKGQMLDDGGQSIEVSIGRLSEEERSQSPQLAMFLNKEEYRSCSMVALKVAGAVNLVFFIADGLRPDAKDAIAELRRGGKEPLLLSGDRMTAVATIAGRFTPPLPYHAEQSPSDKAEMIMALQKEGKKVLMVGDGINDAPALALATVGIAMGSGADVAIESAPITLKSASIAKVAQCVRLSDSTFRIIKQNLAWAFLYNLVLIPVAAGGGLSPMLASGAMAASSLCVVFNGMRLLRFR